MYSFDLFFHKKAAKAHNDKQYYIYLDNPCLLHLAICMLNLISFVFSLLLKSHEIVIKANKNKAPVYEIDILIWYYNYLHASMCRISSSLQICQDISTNSKTD